MNKNIIKAMKLVREGEAQTKIARICGSNPAVCAKKMLSDKATNDMLIDARTNSLSAKQVVEKYKVKPYLGGYIAAAARTKEPTDMLGTEPVIEQKTSSGLFDQPQLCYFYGTLDGMSEVPEDAINQVAGKIAGSMRKDVGKIFVLHLKNGLTALFERK